MQIQIAVIKFCEEAKIDQDCGQFVMSGILKFFILQGRLLA